jgi:hypothetical protein
MSQSAEILQTSAPRVRWDSVLPPRLVGALVGGTLPALVFSVLSRAGLTGQFGGRGNTLEGFPFEALMVTIGTVVGLCLGYLVSRRVAAARGPVRWIVGLAVIAPPLGGLVFQLLTAIQAATSSGDFSRWASSFPVVLMYSFDVALPATAAVSVIGTLLVRRLVAVPRPPAVAVCSLLVASAIVVGGGSLAATVGTFGVGPGRPSPVPTLAVPPPIARDTAIAVAQPHATELSRTPAVLVSANAYKISDLCTQEGGFPSAECDYPGTGWAVVFSITDPAGLPSTVLVMIDAVSGELLYTSQ